MTKISNQVVYIPDTEINGLDYFIGTDYDNAKKTVNFRVEDLGSHFNMVNGVRNFDYIFYQHQGVNPTPTDGYFYSNGNTQIPEDIEYFIFPKKTYRGKDSSQFFLSIATENPFDLIIAQKIDNNTVFFFRIDSIETFTNYFKLNVSEVFFPDGKALDYVLSYAVFNLKSEGGPSVTKTSDLINDGSDGTSTYVEADELGAVATSNDYNDLDNLPTIPTVPNFADQTETNAGVVSDKTIAPSTLAGWWTYVKGLAQTFSERITFGKEIKLTPIATPTYEKGLVYFDDTNDCISFLDSISGTSVQVGYEVLMRARNNTGTTILNGSVVYISGAIGQNSTVALAQANTLPTSEIIGIATHDIPNNTVGKICVFGLVNDLNTSSFTDGQMLYLSATVAGGLTSTIPASPNFVVALGVVEHAHPTQGKILVKPQRALANNNALGTAQNVPPTQNAVKTANDLKQDVLISGTNIKTINGNSILGSGDLQVSVPFDIIKDYPNQIVISATGNSFTNIGTYAQTVTGTQSDILISSGGVAFRKILSATTAGSNANFYDSGVYRVTGTKGFYYRARIKNDDTTNISTHRFSYGFSGTAIMGNINPSTHSQALLCFGADNSDTNCQIMYKLSGGATTKINLGATMPKSQTNDYVIEFWRLEGTTTINYKVHNLTTSSIVSGSFTFAFAGLALGCFRNNDIATTAVSFAVRRVELYIND